MEICTYKKPDKFFMGKPSQTYGVLSKYKPSQTYGVLSKYGVTQFYLQPDISEHTTRLNPSQWRLVLDLPTPEGWKAELT